MVAGDSVWIGAGDFSSETMTLTDKDYGSWTHFLGDYDGSQTGDVGEIIVNAVCSNTDWGQVHISHIHFRGWSACGYDAGIVFFNGVQGVERLIIEHCVVDTAVALYLGGYVEFTNNYVKDAGGKGFYASVLISHFDTAYIYNNTLSLITWSNSRDLVLFVRGFSGDKFWIRNNLFSKIIAEGHYVGLQDWAAVDYEAVDHNYFDDDYTVGQFSGTKNGIWTWYDSLWAWTNGTNLDSNSQVGEADDQLEADGYYLSEGSDCIDVGYDVSAIVTDDIDGDARPQNDVFDVGCDEYVTEAPPPTGQVIIIGDASNFHHPPRAHLKWREL